MGRYIVEYPFNCYEDDYSLIEDRIVFIEKGYDKCDITDLPNGKSALVYGSIPNKIIDMNMIHIFITCCVTYFILWNIYA